MKPIYKTIHYRVHPNKTVEAKKHKAMKRRISNLEKRGYKYIFVDRCLAEDNVKSVFMVFVKE